MVHTLGALEQPEITRDYARLRLWVPHSVFVVMRGRSRLMPSGAGAEMARVRLYRIKQLDTKACYNADFRICGNVTVNVPDVAALLERMLAGSALRQTS